MAHTSDNLQKLTTPLKDPTLLKAL